MEVQTKTMGVVSVDDSRILNFPKGLFGFEDYHKYALIEAEYEPFFWLQSLDEKSLAFLLIDPFLIVNDYELDIDDKMLIPPLSDWSFSKASAIAHGFLPADFRKP